MNKLYSALTKQNPDDFEKNLKEEDVVVEDDMILLHVGEKLIEEGRAEEAFACTNITRSPFRKLWSPGTTSETFIGQGKIKAKPKNVIILKRRLGTRK